MDSKNDLLMNLDKIHTTELGALRIKKNLSLDVDDVVAWCKMQIGSAQADIIRNGKNWYVSVEGCVITVNAYSYTIITAHKEGKGRSYSHSAVSVVESAGEDMLCNDIRYLTERALWETENLMKCIPDELWNKRYDGLPMWKYLYHTLYSMDRWYINPCDASYQDPAFHTETLADLNVIPGDGETIDRSLMEAYFYHIRKKIRQYIAGLQDIQLAECPEHCDMSRFRLILGQFRHWHRHMGVIYGFIIEDTGKWPYVLNMHGEYPVEPMPNYY